MNEQVKGDLLEHFARIFAAAEDSRAADRCLVAPSPELQEKLRAELDQIRGGASPALGRLLKAREQNRVGFNDGLIFPGSHFPVGTPANLVRSAAANRAPLRGDINVVVVLVDFSDEGFSAAHNQQHYSDLFFSEGVLPNGSVREYYHEVTGGLIRISGQVVGPYRMPHTLAYYANGESGTGSVSPNARDLANDAVEAADSGVDFSLYDNDGDGFVDAFIVLQAGPGAESTGNSGHIWSHKWVLPSIYNTDGTKVYAYLVVPEEARIGVCCHELGHLLFGFPDLYDTDYSSSGVGNWCLMGGGSWNGNGDVPAHPSAWCKANQEWVTVLNPTSNSVENIEDVKSSGTIYRLWKDGASGDEYFLVENRQRAGYDQFIPGEGLLIWHIDDAASSNADETHPKVALVQADNLKDLEAGNDRGDAGDPFPGATGNSAFNANSSPSSRSYGNMDTCVAVENVGPSGAVMTANLKVKCPVVKSAASEKAVHKEFRKELAKDYFKENIKERVKEHFKEIKEKEFKEWKEKEFKEFKEKDIEGPGGWGRTATGKGEEAGGAPAYAATSLEARLAAVEQQLAGIVPFIHAGLRPDLSMGALAQEEDVSRMRREMMERGQRARAAQLAHEPPPPPAAGGRPSTAAGRPSKKRVTKKTKATKAKKKRSKRAPRGGRG